MNRISIPTLATLAVLVSTGCSVDRGPIDPEHEAAVVEAGGHAADALVANLVSHLSSAMADGGPVAAVEFCSTSAQDLTAGVAAAEDVRVKRTTFRYRNPANAPDEHETQALRHFEAVLAETGELPAAWVQRVGLDEYRYYRPLTIAPPCLACHGSAEDIDPAVAEILAERYPEDQATGYQARDFRGLVRVSIPSERIEAMVDHDVSVE